MPGDRPHPLVEQLRFTRSELMRGLAGVDEADGLRRVEPMNSIGWLVAHLAWQEQRYWLTRAQGLTLEPVLNEIAAWNGPPSTPPLGEMVAAWERVTAAGDPWLSAVTAADLVGELGGDGPPRRIGTSILRVTYHYWFHNGEIQATRQVLGHGTAGPLPEFVGDIDDAAPYRPA